VKLKNPAFLLLKSQSSFRLGAGILLVFYLAVYLVPPGLLPHGEHDHLGLVDSSIEKDPCHIAIYHPGIVGGCHHKYHFTKAFPDCHQCQVTLVRQLMTEPVIVVDESYSCLNIESFNYSRQSFDLLLTHDDRGPPYFMTI
jgi:hypothetical protein